MDMEGAISRDVQPYFQLPLHRLPSPQMLCESHNNTVRACLSAWAREFPGESTAIDIFADLELVMMWVSGQLIVHGSDFWSRADTANSWLLPLIHRCLQLAGRDAVNSNQRPFEHALRHAIILFLAPFRRCFGIPATGMDIHLSKLISALRQCFEHGAASRLWKMLLWMMVVGGLEGCNLGWDVSWLFARIFDGCAVIGLKEYEDVREAVCYTVHQMVWLDEALSPALDLMMERFRAYVRHTDGDHEVYQKVDSIRL